MDPGAADVEAALLARSPTAADVGGYGLHLPDRLAARWGVAGSAPTTVWTELR